MADQYGYPYVDSGVFIGWVKGEVCDGVDRRRIADHILRLAETGTFRICISALTLAEVHKLRTGTPLNDTEDERLLEFFEHSYFDIVDVDREIGEHANRLCRQHGLYPNDAIHLACAMRAGCDALLSWDRDFKGIECPNLRIEKPEMRGQSLEMLEAFDKTQSCETIGRELHEDKAHSSSISTSPPYSLPPDR